MADPRHPEQLRARLCLAMLIATAASLGSCATTKPAKLPVCDGNPKHRRDANPYGTVLPGTPLVTHVPAPAGASPLPIPPSNGGPPTPAPGDPATSSVSPGTAGGLSAIVPHFSYSSC